MSRTAASLGLLLLLLQHTAAASGRTALAGHGELARSIDAAVTKKGLPSVVVVVFDDHRVLWSHVAGYADLKSRVAPTLRTRFRLGSMAKAITSTILAIAEQRGSISLGEKVLLPTSDGYHRVSLSNLVNMQAGLAQAVCYEGITGDTNPDCGPDFDARFGVSITAGKHRYSYSNMGAQLAAEKEKKKKEKRVH